MELLRRWRGRARCRRGCWAGAAALLCLAGLLSSGAHEELLSRLMLPVLLPPPAEFPDGSAAPFPPGAYPLEPEPCGAVGDAPFLLVLVTSAPGHAERRAAVRETWGSALEAAGHPVRTVFLLGEPSAGEAQAGALQAEAARFGDVLQARFRDTYRNLTLKTLSGLSWARSRCQGARFVVKADDDVFLNLPGLARALDAIRAPVRAPGAYLGRVHWRVPPDRDPASRHYVPSALYPPPFFPAYCSGTAYALSGEAVGAVLRASARERLLPVEDVFVGLCAHRAGLAPRHLPGLSGAAGCPPDPCCLRRVLLSTHQVAPDDMRHVWHAPETLSCAPLPPWLARLRCRALAWLAGL